MDSILNYVSKDVAKCFRDNHIILASTHQYMVQYITDVQTKKTSESVEFGIYKNPIDEIISNDLVDVYVKYYYAPLLTDAKRFFVETYHIDIQVDYESETKSWQYTIINLETNQKIYDVVCYKTYEDALNNGLIYTILHINKLFDYA